VGGEQAASQGLALFRKQQGHQVVYILYDAKALVDASQEPGFLSSRMSKPIDEILFGYVKAFPHAMDSCWNATEIKFSAATKGYGPLMYDIVMSDSEGGLMPDRVSVSPAAQKVYQFYKKRGDVDVKPFDDIEDPKTPDEIDDCTLMNDPNKFLNYAYDGPGQSGAKAKLMQNHEKVVDEIEKKGDLKRNAIEGILVNMGHTFFDKKYG